MVVKGREMGTYYIIDVIGDFNARNIVSIRSVIEDAIEMLGHNVVVFDLSSCRSIDSTSIGLIMNLYKRLIKNNGKVGLLGLNSNLQDIIRISNLQSLISIYNSEEELEIDI